MKDNILIRVDYLPANGLGHIIRQINLVNNLNLKTSFFFILANKSSISLKDILPKNCKIISFKSYENGKINIQKDCSITLKYLKKYNCSNLFVDNFKLSKNWYNKIYKNFKNIIIFHDFMTNFKCKIIVTNILKNNKDKKIFPMNELIFLNRKIINKRVIKKNLNFAKCNIDFGSIDQNNLTEFVLDTILKNNLSFTKINVFLGPYNNNAINIKNKFGKNKNIYFSNLKFPRKYDSKSGIYFGNCGITATENYFLGKISFIFLSSKNQYQRMRYLKIKPNVNYIGSVFSKRYANINLLNNININQYVSKFDDKKIMNIKNNEIDKLKQYITNFKSLL